MVWPIPRSRFADGAGISKGTLYYHFNTKDSILHSVVDDFRISRRIMQKYRSGELDRGQLREAIVADSKNILKKK
jgi:AcrR family transcriptional regulator